MKILYLRAVCPLFVVLMLPVTITSAAADESFRNGSVLTFKSGSYSLDSDRQTIGGQTWNYGGTTNRFGVEAEAWMDPEKQFTLGGEFMHFSTEEKSATNSNVLDVFSLLLRGKRFFGSANDVWRPYIGGGIGVVDAFDGGGGAVSGDATGLALQGFVGFQVRSNRVGFRLEYAHLLADAGDIDVSGNRIFAGLCFFFGKTTP